MPRPNSSDWHSTTTSRARSRNQSDQSRRRQGRSAGRLGGLGLRYVLEPLNPVTQGGQRSEPADSGAVSGWTSRAPAEPLRRRASSPPRSVPDQGRTTGSPPHGRLPSSGCPPPRWAGGPAGRAPAASEGKVGSSRLLRPTLGRLRPSSHDEPSRSALQRAAAFLAIHHPPGRTEVKWPPAESSSGDLPGMVPEERYVRGR
jgi:hypothetical protein